MDRSLSLTGRRRKRTGWRRFVIIVLAFAAVLIALPYLLVPFYGVGHPVSTLMLMRWVTGERVERRWVPLDAIAPVLPVSVIAAEDGRFCLHHGVDWGQIREALDEADSFSEARGGSTITQQVVKNLFLWPGRSIIRKMLELPLALWTDLVLPKRRIMEIYLNIAQWGPNGEFGAEAGARRAFGHGIERMTPREAALLAAMLPNPVRRNAKRPSPGLRRLAGIYQGRARRVAARAHCVRAESPTRKAASGR